MSVLLAAGMCVAVSICAEAAIQVAQGSASAPAASSVPAEVITIRGRDHPERIPDHWLWRSVFLKLSEISRSGQRGDLAHALPLSAADAQVLYMEAGQQGRRDDDCDRALQLRRDELKEQRLSPEVEARALDDVTIGCRTRDLDAAERVLDAISEEGRVVLQAWLDEQRRGMTILVPERDVRVFKLPR